MLTRVWSDFPDAAAMFGASHVETARASPTKMLSRAVTRSSWRGCCAGCRLGRMEHREALEAEDVPRMMMEEWLIDAQDRRVKFGPWCASRERRRVQREGRS